MVEGKKKGLKIKMFYQMISYSSMALWVQAYNIFSSKPIKSKGDVIIVGGNIAHKLYGENGLIDFGKYEKTPQVKENDELYSVWYRPNPRKYIAIVDGEFKEEMGYPDGKRGPCIKIEKSIGKIVSWGLQK